MNYDTVILSRFDVSMAWKKVVPLPSGLLYIKADAYSRLVTVTSLFLCLLAIFVFSYWYEIPAFLRLTVISVAVILFCLNIRNLWSLCTPIIFDRNSGFYYIGRKKGSLEILLGRRRMGSINEIIGIQVLNKRVYSKRRHGGELNLLLKGKRRTHLFISGDMDTLINGAKLISDFLNVPVYRDCPQSCNLEL